MTQIQNTKRPTAENIIATLQPPFLDLRSPLMFFYSRTRVKLCGWIGLSSAPAALWDLEPTAMAPMMNALAMLAAAATSAQAFVASPNAVQLRSSSAAAAPSRPAATDRSTRHTHTRAGRRARTAATAPPGPMLASAEATTYELDEKELRGPLVPIEDTIMVKVDQPETVTDGGLFLPKMKSAKITRGTVTAVGEGKWHWDTGVQIPITVEVGDRVVYGNYDGTSVEYQGAEHLLMRDTELLMAYEGEEVCALCCSNRERRHSPAHAQ